MKYVVTIEGREFEVEVDGARVSIDGVAAVVEGAPAIPAGLWRFQIDERLFTVPMQGTGRGHWAITAGGEQIPIEVVDERTRHIRSLVGSSAAGGGAGGVKAPMPGLVVRILVAVGDQVAEGQPLLVLEAMKMENELRAPRAGRVGAVAAVAGQAVDKGATLVTIEA